MITKMIKVAYTFCLGVVMVIKMVEKIDENLKKIRLDIS